MSIVIRDIVSQNGHSHVKASKFLSTTCPCSCKQIVNSVERCARDSALACVVLMVSIVFPVLVVLGSQSLVLMGAFFYDHSEDWGSTLKASKRAATCLYLCSQQRVRNRELERAGRVTVLVCDRSPWNSHLIGGGRLMHVQYRFGLGFLLRLLATLISLFIFGRQTHHR